MQLTIVTKTKAVTIVTKQKVTNNIQTYTK